MAHGEEMADWCGKTWCKVGKGSRIVSGSALSREETDLGELTNQRSGIPLQEAAGGSPASNLATARFGDLEARCGKAPSRLQEVNASEENSVKSRDLQQ